MVTCKSLMRRCSVISTFVCSLVFALTVGLCSVRGEEVNEGRPNVVFIAVDDMNDWIGCLNAVPHALTPNIDRLAQRGVNFTNAHTAGVFCAPSRAAIFSGQYASTTGCYRTATYFVDHPEIQKPRISNIPKSNKKTCTVSKARNPQIPNQTSGWPARHTKSKIGQPTPHPKCS